jgi:hypothetical protein
MSVGAMLALEIVTKYSHLLAGAVPAAAGVLYGYWQPPTEPIPFMDIHGTSFCLCCRYFLPLPLSLFHFTFLFFCVSVQLRAFTRISVPFDHGISLR